MIMAGHSWKLLVSFVVFLVGLSSGACAAVAPKIMSQINHINSEGQYLGIIVPNSYEMDPLLNSSSFHAHEKFPYLDFAGRRFRLGRVENESVIIVMTGLSMLNAGITTQLLLALFNVKGVLHYGIAGNANPNLQIGDVTIPRYWAHSGLWNWQRFGDGTEDQLALESNGDYTREVGYLNISNYNNGTETENLLNNVWYQPEEIFPVNGTPEVRQHVFWVPVDRHYFALAKKIEGLNLDQCVNSTTCLPRAPIVARVERGMSANVYLDNRAYRQFLYSKFNATPVEMESAAIALVCHQRNMPFITIRALSDLAGGGSALSNEADTFSSLAAKNSVEAVVAFIGLLSS